jgi:precorrin-6B methylase 2
MCLRQSTSIFMLVCALWVTTACHPAYRTAGTGVHDESPPPPLDVPYVPTPQDVVTYMLKLAQVGPNDVVYDLGAGDGRIVITAAQQFGARAVGIDLDPARIAEANANAQRAGVSDRVQFIEQDLFTADISEATVVTLFLRPSLNLRLRPKLWRDLKPGTRVVAHLYDMGDWKPDKVEHVDRRPVYYWIIPDDAPARAAKAELQTTPVAAPETAR